MEALARGNRRAKGGEVATAKMKTGRGDLRATAKPELLAPAGDRTCLIAAVENGADAVYFGLQRHNARARAVNFDGGELPDVMALLHRRGVKGYVTLNTLVFPRELEDLEAIRPPAGRGGGRCGDRPGPRPGPPDPRGDPRPGNPRLDADVDHQRRGGPAGPGARLLAGDPGARALPRGDRQGPRDRHAPRRGLRPRGALRGLFGAVPDQRGPGRAIGQPRRVCPGLPDALPDRLRRRAARPGATSSTCSARRTSPRST